MNVTHPTRWGWGGLLALVAASLLIAGCAGTPDSDIPWSTPQPWEGAPSIPGFNRL